jgi:hypothetical protein
MPAIGEWVVQGSQDVAEIFLQNKSQHPVLYLGLFTNNLPSGNLNNATLASIVEPVASDYIRLPLSPANWNVYGEVSVYPDEEFEVILESLGTIYGCFITTSPNPAGDAAGKLIAMNLFSAPIDLLYYGDKVRITPRITIT